ncbi:hypothetical protein BGY98DRAFT_678570 [Russula aff. rugulosa BPL654]|nr:hypothetical protein BGY98DRAFT_678570 [Russula aff. rugulosa BPL654]
MVNSLTCKLDDRNEKTHDQSPPPLSPAPAPAPPAPAPAPAPAAPPHTPEPVEKTNFGNPSGPLFSLYSEIADEEDKEMAARWQQDAKDILIFTGLFSAAVSVLLSVSVLDLKPNSQDISAVYLANIYQVLARADLNITLPPTSIPPIPSPEPFSPPRSAIWVNSLWVLSLVINLTCALLATSLHQWSRRYNTFTHPSRCSPERRARLRAFFRRGMDNMYLPSTVEALPALIHLSLFLFFAGLAVFLFNINHDVFNSVIWWILGFTAIYGWMTLMPIFRHDSPYYSPLSSTAWTLHAVVSYTLFRVLAFITSGSDRIRRRFRDLSERCCDLSERYRKRISSHVQKVAEETMPQSSELDLEILDYTIGSAVGDDKTLEGFLEAIPGFFKSSKVNDLKGSPSDKPEVLSKIADVRLKIVDSLQGFMERNLSSNAVTEEINTRRLIICMNATKEIGESGDIYKILSSLSQGTLGEDDNLLEKLFDINHGFLKSIPDEDTKKEKSNPRLRHALDGLLCRTLSANTVAELVKIRRLDVYLNAIKVIYGDEDVNDALFEILGGEFGQLPASMEIAYTLKRWCADREDLHHMVRIAPTWFADTLIRTLHGNAISLGLNSFRTNLTRRMVSCRRRPFRIHR